MDLSDAVPDVDMAAGSSHDEAAGDFAEVFQLPKITGDGDEEMAQSELFQPETTVIHVDDALTMEDNKANEEGILDFLTCMDEYKTLTPADVILEEDDDDDELGKTNLGC